MLQNAIFSPLPSNSELQQVSRADDCSKICYCKNETEERSARNTTEKKMSARIALSWLFIDTLGFFVVVALATDSSSALEDHDRLGGRRRREGAFFVRPGGNHYSDHLSRSRLQRIEAPVKVVKCARRVKESNSLAPTA